MDSVPPPPPPSQTAGFGGVFSVDSDVLLLSYLDKICLALTGELRRALACLYSEGQAI